MAKIPRQELLNKATSLFKLCNMAAMRAIELNSGMKKLVEKVTTTAIREIAAGKVKFKETGKREE
jgi:DNA-directed RNA polymerase omega subunit